MTILFILLGILAVTGIVFLAKGKKKKPKPEPVKPPVVKPEPKPVQAISEIYEYTSFQKDKYSLYSTEGKNVVLLTKNKLKTADAKFLIDYLDDAWSFYADRASGEPSEGSSYNGKVIIAEVDKTCGAGCGYLGAQGIEIQSDYMQKAIASAKNKQVDRIFLYEMGRNWWLYTAKVANNDLPYKSAVITGFAVYMSFRIADYLREKDLDIAPFNDIPFDKFQDEVDSLADLYIGKRLKYSETISINKGIEGERFSGAVDLFSSILTHVDDKYAEGSLSDNIWIELSKRSDTTDEQQSINNLVNAINSSVNKNLSVYFKNTLRFDILK